MNTMKNSRAGLLIQGIWYDHRVTSKTGGADCFCPFSIFAAFINPRPFLLFICLAPHYFLPPSPSLPLSPTLPLSPSLPPCPS
eukprot:753769-Hanusia_phi.AAC.1